MKCSPKTMLTVALSLALAGLLTYFAFPAAQALILANAPLLVALICPVSMLIMMWSMRGSGSNAGTCHSDQPARELPAPDAARQKS